MTNFFIPLVDARCRYKAPALYDDELIVRTHVRNFRERIIVFAYELVRASDNTLLAEGETTHVITGADFKPRGPAGEVPCGSGCCRWPSAGERRQVREFQVKSGIHDPPLQRYFPKIGAGCYVDESAQIIVDVKLADGTPVSG